MPSSAATPAVAPAAVRGSTRHAGLDRDDVVERALQIVEERGAAALTMRKLAADLGVTTTTIYWHVGSRDDLVIAVVRRLAERQAAAEVIGNSSHDRVLSAATNIWTNALAHRNVTALASQVGATTLLELPLEVALASELEVAGLRGTEVRDALRSILACIAGFLIMAWRPDPGGELSAGRLWADVEPGSVDPATIAAMTEPPDLHALFGTTVRAVIDAHLPGTRRPATATRTATRSPARTTTSRRTT